MLLHAFSQKTSSDPHQIFAQALKEHPEQVFVKTPTNVNHAIQTQNVFESIRDQHMTLSKLWQGEKSKGERPQDYTNTIVAAAVIPGTHRETTYGQTYDRVSIQPSWLGKHLVVVKEEVHVDDCQKKMVFLGKTVDIAIAKKLLIDALLNEHFAHHSSKTQQIFKNLTIEQATEYLNKEFENHFCRELQPLFHVEHGILGTEDEPFETWKLVRLAPAPLTTAEVIATQELREFIAKSISTKLYTQTLTMHEKNSNKI